MLVATTGLRNGELFALKASKVDIGRLQIRIDQQLVEEDRGQRYIDRPKHGSARTVTFAGFLAQDLQALIDHRQAVSGETDPTLFCARQGGLEWRTTHTRRFRRAARAAGWPHHLTWYGLRHLYAVTMLDLLPLEVVSQLMGHHSPHFTAQRYLPLRGDGSTKHAPPPRHSQADPSQPPQPYRSSRARSAPGPVSPRLIVDSARAGNLKARCRALSPRLRRSELITSPGTTSVTGPDNAVLHGTWIWPLT